MAKGRRSVLGTAASVVGTALAGCLDGNGEGTGTNRTTPNVSTVSTDPEEPPTVESSFLQYQSDAANTGVADASGPTGAISSLFEFGTVGSDRRLGSPTVTNGIVYVASTTAAAESETVETGTATPEGNVTTTTATATESETTAETTLTGTTTGTTTTAVEVETEETVVAAIDAADGTELWATTYATAGAPGPTAIVDDDVLAPVGENVVALDGATGDQQWAYNCGLASGITVADDAVYVVGVADGTATLYSLATDGTVRWATDIDAGTITTPAVADGTVYVGGAALQAFDTADGTEQWRVDTGVSTPPVVVEDSVVVGSTGSLRAYATDGTEQWSTDLDAETPVTNPPAVADGTVYLCVDGGIAAYHLDNGDEIYAVETGLDATPVLADDYLYLVGDRQLTCLTAADGETEWSYGTQQAVDTGGVAPAVVDEVAYFPAERLYAITE